jgi:hypothetical protein
VHCLLRDLRDWSFGVEKDEPENLKNQLSPWKATVEKKNDY